jgi:NAD(P)-dependent dehydrogenase (short-subunit alcohol dehydrogenase family)
VTIVPDIFGEEEEDMMKRSVLITGGSRGIGAATARVFAGAGWDVAIQYHRRRSGMSF